MMNNASHSLPFDDEESVTRATETTPGGDKEIRWVIIKKTPGLMQASIMAGRLQSEDIPARAWQEGAGLALGLTVGILGTGYLAVPEEFASKAQEILAEEEEYWEEE